MRLRKGKAGFILIELIIATAILAAVIPLSKFFINSVKASNEAKIQQTANHIAQQYIEEYKAKDLNELYGITPDDYQIEHTENINGKIWSVLVDLDWNPIETSGLLGTVKISQDGSNINVVLSNSNATRSFSVVAGTSHSLKLDNAKRLIWDPGTFSIEFPVTTDEPKQLNLIVNNNPDLDLTLRNCLSSIEQLIINKTENPEATRFKLDVYDPGTVVEGETESEESIDVTIRDTQQIEPSELGVNISVTVKDDNDIEFAKIAETRKLEW